MSSQRSRREQVQPSRNIKYDEETVTIAFEDDPNRIAAFDAWKEKRAKWARAEQPQTAKQALLDELPG